ncbi:MAG: undecaprenyl diphosphate synthase [Clostridia bacterium]|nr:undecaprenyl diphosphate synthase [Clostridia bacterium]MDN5322474.1 undecaprenyl diphosphate synthase [Clostridia bacterium]
MSIPTFKRLPKHIGFIPDGNRRWAQSRGLPKQAGYKFGIDPGFELYKICLELGISEITFYGFTQDNTKRPSEQTKAFQKACVDAVTKLAHKDAELLVIGNSNSPMFPKELLPFTKRVRFGKGLIKVNFLVNYGWNWDLNYTLKHKGFKGEWNYDSLLKSIASSDISRIDLIVRWGGRRRLSGFLPVQSIYADFYVVDELWPDFRPEQFYRALEWYQEQDITLGG